MQDCGSFLTFISFGFGLISIIQSALLVKLTNKEFAIKQEVKSFKEKTSKLSKEDQWLACAEVLKKMDSYEERLAAEYSREITKIILGDLAASLEAARKFEQN